MRPVSICNCFQAGPKYPERLLDPSVPFLLQSGEIEIAAGFSLYPPFESVQSALGPSRVAFSRLAFAGASFRTRGLRLSTLVSREHVDWIYERGTVWLVGCSRALGTIGSLCPSCCGLNWGGCWAVTVIACACSRAPNFHRSQLLSSGQYSQAVATGLYRTQVEAFPAGPSREHAGVPCQKGGLIALSSSLAASSQA
jgi:hypothetical protein